MARDDEVRRLERATGASPEDGAGWLLLSHALERAGRHDEAARAATRAYRLAPEEPARRARLVEVGRGHGLWPSERGCAGNRQASPLRGPEAGVMRWRLPLPRDPVGRPLVDLGGRVVVRCAASLLEVDPEGRGVTPGPEWAGAALAASLRGGRPCAFDVQAGTVFGPERTAVLVKPVHAAARGPGAFAVDRRGLVGLDGSGALVWSRPLGGTIADLAAGAAGPVAAYTAAPDEDTLPTARVVAVDGATGRELWRWGERSTRRPDLADLVGPAASLPPGPGFGGPFVGVAADGSVVAATSARRPFVEGGATLSGGLACLSPAGARRWWTKLEVTSGAALHGDRLAVTGPDGVTVLDLATGEPRLRFPARGANPPVFDGRGFLYVSAGDGQLTALAPDGAVAWRLPVRGTGRFGPLALGDDGWGYALFGRELIAFR
jgi:outer membrane protein assembly factor BamB